MQTLQLQRIGDIMLEDLLELRRILDRFIAKYREQDKYRFEHDPRLEEDFAIQGDDRLETLGKTLLKLRKEDDSSEKTEYPKEWRGNDIY